MSSSLIALCGFIYAAVAFNEYRLGHWWMSTVYQGYAYANIGLFMLARTQP